MRTREASRKNMCDGFKNHTLATTVENMTYTQFEKRLKNEIITLNPSVMDRTFSVLHVYRHRNQSADSQMNKKN